MYNGLETMQNDVNIIEQVLAGDTEAFRFLVERYERPVLSFVQHLLLDPGDSPDLAQEVFLTAYAKLSCFDPAFSRFSTWLFTIARNKTINTNKRKRPHAVSVLPERKLHVDVAEDLSRRELFNKLDAALAKLPAKQRRAFILAQIEQLPYEDVAQIEGTRVGTIKSRVNRAKEKLRASLTANLRDSHA
ncbi:RNA polymerase sigma factor [Planctomycetota bacterium]